MDKWPLKSYVQALRPHQWLKNLLVFLPMLAGHELQSENWALSLLAFVSFSFVASGIYVMNDLSDIAADRAHPRKRLRPFASGSIPLAYGPWMAAVLLIIGGLFAVSINLAFLLAVAGYGLIATGYSRFLKSHMIIDICALAGLYTLRILAGGLATNIMPSVWLLAFSVFMFLALAAVKRQAELVDSSRNGKLKPGGRGYLVSDLPIISMISIGSGYVSVLVMALYVTSPGVVQLYPSPVALLGVCAVLLYWITRTVMVTHRGLMNDDPVVYASKDRISQICLLIILGFCILALLP